uniref:AS1 protein n=1 Tax=Onchocerca volvulus TaxID=6282 RepID=Q25625_ONCVO|nr:aS1 [Onchocerca volvulus]
MADILLMFSGNQISLILLQKAVCNPFEFLVGDDFGGVRECCFQFFLSFFIQRLIFSNDVSSCLLKFFHIKLLSIFWSQRSYLGNYLIDKCFSVWL